MYTDHSDYCDLHCIGWSKVHERKIVPEPELLVTADALVVIDQVAAAVADELAAIDLDCLRVVGRMTVDEIDPRFSDEIVCQGALLVGDVVAPVAAPMYRDKDNIAGPLDSLHNLAYQS